jgi:fermentation-respiration switch protein FrsA (DUF1100 family)
MCFLLRVCFCVEFVDTQVKATIVENTFTSISEMVDRVFPFLTPIKKWMLKIDWSSDKRIVSITHPVLFISGLRDELVPPEHMQKLYDLARSCKNRELLRIPDGTHNETWRLGGTRYLVAIRKFLLEIVFPNDSWTSGTFAPAEPASPSTTTVTEEHRVLSKN